MRVICFGYHPGLEQIACLDTDRGELSERGSVSEEVGEEEWKGVQITPRFIDLDLYRVPVPA
jgi:hypothetical protein